MILPNFKGSEAHAKMGAVLCLDFELMQVG